MCVAKCMTLPVNVFFRAIWCCLLLGFGPFIRWENHSWAMETGEGSVFTSLYFEYMKCIPRHAYFLKMFFLASYFYTK